MKPRNQAILALNENGYVFKRSGKKHDIYYNQEAGSMIPLKRHDFNENDLNYILTEIKHNRRAGS